MPDIINVNKKTEAAAKVIADMKKMAKGNAKEMKLVAQQEARFLQLQQQQAKMCFANAKSMNQLQSMDTASFKTYAANSFGTESKVTIEELQSKNVSMDDMKKALSTDGNTTVKTETTPVPANDAFSTSFPNSTILSWWQVALFAANPATSFLFAPWSPYKLFAISSGHSIGIGVNGSAGAGGGFTLGAGLVYLPTGEIAIYGGASVNLGFFASISGTLAFTHVFGGKSTFSGSAIGIFAGGGELVVGQGTILFATSLPVKVIGYVLEVGIGAGLSPFEVGANLGATGVLDKAKEDQIKEYIRRKISG